jgi:hypothetical protein
LHTTDQRSASLRMTKERVESNGKGGAPEWRTADPSPALRSGRDDKKERVFVRKGRLLEERAVAEGKGGC